MKEALYLLFFLSVWFIVPFLLGTWFFRLLKKRWKALGNDGSWPKKIRNYSVFLACALIGWMLEMLMLTGIEMLF